MAPRAASRSAALAIAFGLCTAAAVHAQPGPAARSGAMHGAATRSVSSYLARERSLQEALARRDAAAARDLLAEDFEARGPSGVDPVDRESWLRRELAPNTPERPVRDLDVREFDDVAVVTFVLGGPGVGRRSGGGPIFSVVDVWRRSSGRLLMRVVERPAHPTPAPTRPSGRE